MINKNAGSQASGKVEKHAGNDDETKVNIFESEDDDPRADVDPGRTPGKAEGVEDPEADGNE